ncbi:sulfite exporter TauE/SafE family protein [Jatrophihabitans telluris]|uniref:Probable membrane transporter protein n=1 Tax=Jatrophihabitans telluris TaxID=2038343 RepID=A0ABY4QZ26_9ACTN|nr:sulfite exporter TauE/SafE family protein [Jatrophihabitans telluris]UQX88362.1 sulfite exporter TauE/SafE family protein [Jatrophihabitans telluris]
MHIDLALCLAGALVGLLVGLTGMGGGALMTPLLVLVFNVAPLAAISSDLVTSLVMKPVGAAVHLRRGTVQLPLLKWLAIGAVPAGFLGAVLIGTLGRAGAVQSKLKLIIGIALLLSLASTVVRQLISRRSGTPAAELVVRPGRTVAIGVVGGLAVGLTSVGAGSLVIALLLLAYPGLRPGQLVGTDIVQAIPLVGAAAVGHLLFGDVHLALTVSLLVGALPAVYVGARLSAAAPAPVLRSVVAGVLTASALALLKAPSDVLVPAALAAAAGMAWLSRPSGRENEIQERTATPKQAVTVETVGR